MRTFLTSSRPTGEKTQYQRTFSFYPKLIWTELWNTAIGPVNYYKSLTLRAAIYRINTQPSRLLVITEIPEIDQALGSQNIQFIRTDWPVEGSIYEHPNKTPWRLNGSNNWILLPYKTPAPSLAAQT